MNICLEKEVNKMSNRLFQGIVHQMKDAIDRTIGVIDETSVVIACSELGSRTSLSFLPACIRHGATLVCV